jgi:hypothetical protein
MAKNGKVNVGQVAMGVGAIAAVGAGIYVVYSISKGLSDIFAPIDKALHAAWDAVAAAGGAVVNVAKVPAQAVQRVEVASTGTSVAALDATYVDKNSAVEPGGPFTFQTWHETKNFLGKHDQYRYLEVHNFNRKDTPMKAVKDSPYLTENGGWQIIDSSGKKVAGPGAPGWAAKYKLDSVTSYKTPQEWAKPLRGAAFGQAFAQTMGYIEGQLANPNLSVYSRGKLLEAAGHCHEGLGLLYSYGFLE